MIRHLGTIGVWLSLIPMFSFSQCVRGGSETPSPAPEASGAKQGGAIAAVTVTCDYIADRNADSRTRALYDNLVKFSEKGTMFGAQMPTIHGISGGEPWYNTDNTDRSDTKDVAGSHPALCGWEIGGLESGADINLDGDRFDVIIRHMEAAYKRGAANTVTWHCGNPVIGGRYNNTSSMPIHEILPGGSCHDKFMGWLDALAGFLALPKTPEGQPIPIIFRPWHEHTDTGKGSGFWWSVGNNSKEDFIALWRMTFDYLTNEKGLHNLLWAYSPDLHHLCWGQPGIDQYMYMDAWPGDDYVDIMGLDAYETPWSNFRTTAKDIVAYAITLANEKGKPFAITETGFANNNPEHQKYGYDASWWTQQLYPLTHGRKVAYVMIWRDDAFPESNSQYPEYYGGFNGSYSKDDFVKYVGKSDILLEKDLKNLYK